MWDEVKKGRSSKEHGTKNKLMEKCIQSINDIDVYVMIFMARFNVFSKILPRRTLECPLTRPFTILLNQKTKNTHLPDTRQSSASLSTLSATPSSNPALVVVSTSSV